VLGHIGHLRGGPLGGLRHRLRANRRDDEALVCFPQLRLGTRVKLGLGPGGLFLGAQGILAQCDGLFAPVRGFRATKDGLFVRKDRGLPLGEGLAGGRSRRLRAFVCLESPPGRAFPRRNPLLAHHRLPQSTVSDGEEQCRLLPGRQGEHDLVRQRRLAGARSPDNEIEGEFRQAAAQDRIESGTPLIWLAPSALAIGKGACSVIARQRLDRSGRWFVPKVGSAFGSPINISLYFIAFGSGAASSDCAVRGPVRVGIPVINPL
jgi:hypothetical protein